VHEVARAVVVRAQRGNDGFELTGSKDIIQTGETLFSDSWNWHARLFVRVLLEKAKTLILPGTLPASAAAPK
jgi:hypothetical protein